MSIFFKYLYVNLEIILYFAFAMRQPQLLIWCKTPTNTYLCQAVPLSCAYDSAAKQV